VLTNPVGLAMNEFLAEDFARIGDPVMKRCLQIDGKRLYISGVTGFFGKNLLALLDYLHRLGSRFEVTAISRNPQRFMAGQPWSRALPWLDLREGDVRNPWPAEGKYDLVLHAATDTAASAHQDKLEVFESILAGTREALAFAGARGVSRLLLTGSGAQYGSIPEVHANGIPENSLIACDATKTGSAYGEGKRVSEILAALHAERHGFAVINARCFAFVGPGLPLDGHFAIGNFIGDAVAGRPIQLHSGGEAVRSYLYGADLAVWLLLLLMEAPHGVTVNVGSNYGVSVLELAKKVCDLLSPAVSVWPGSSKPENERHFYVPSINIARGLGLEDWTELDQAIIRTASWHRLALD